MRPLIHVMLATALLAGCGGSDAPAVRPASKPPRHPAPRAPHVRPVACPAGTPRCRSATGSVLYVEAVDPDGDGDAHFVLASGDSVTGPGVSVIDVEASLRPRRLPRVGDAVAAAGPVYRGGYGQRQIQ